MKPAVSVHPVGSQFAFRLDPYAITDYLQTDNPGWCAVSISRAAEPVTVIATLAELDAVYAQIMQCECGDGDG